MNGQILSEVAANFHFLRPEWLYALIPALLLFLALRYRQHHHSNWEKAIDPAPAPPTSWTTRIRRYRAAP